MTNPSLPTGPSGSEGDSEKKKWGYKRQQFDAVISTTRFNGAIDNLVNGSVDVRALIAILDELNASNQRGRYMAEVLALKQESRRLATVPYSSQVAEFLKAGARRIPWLSDGLASQMAVALASAADNAAYLDTVDTAVGDLLLDLDRPLKPDTRNYLRALTAKIEATRRLQEARGHLSAVPSIYPPVIPEQLAGAQASPAPPVVQSTAQASPAKEVHPDVASSPQASPARPFVASSPQASPAKKRLHPDPQWPENEPDLLPAVSPSEEVTRRVGRGQLRLPEIAGGHAAEAGVPPVGDASTTDDEYVELEPTPIDPAEPAPRSSAQHEPVKPVSERAVTPEDLSDLADALADDDAADASAKSPPNASLAKSAEAKQASASKRQAEPQRPATHGGSSATVPGLGGPSATPVTAHAAEHRHQKQNEQGKSKLAEPKQPTESHGFPIWIMVLSLGGVVAVGGGLWWFTQGRGAKFAAEVRSAASAALAKASSTPASSARPPAAVSVRPPALAPSPASAQPPAPAPPPASVQPAASVRAPTSAQVTPQIPPPPAVPAPRPPAAAAPVKVNPAPAKSVPVPSPSPRQKSTPTAATPVRQKSTPTAAMPVRQKSVQPVEPKTEPKSEPVDAPTTSEPVSSPSTPKPSRTIDDILIELLQIPGDSASIEAKAHEVARIVARSGKTDAEQILMRLIPEEVLAGKETVDSRTLEPVRRVVALLLKKVALDKDDNRAAIAIDSLGEWAKSRKHGAAAKLTLDQLAEEAAVVSRPRRLRALQRVQARLGISNAGE
jgi:hypothetical protein